MIFNHSNIQKTIKLKTVFANNNNMKLRTLLKKLANPPEFSNLKLQKLSIRYWTKDKQKKRIETSFNALFNLNTILF
jgi:hypothetical protein